MINRRGFLASALALGLTLALPLAPRPVRRWIASARARWARRRMWGCLTSDAEIARMVARGFPARIEDIPGALASNGAQPSTDYEQLRIADLPTLPPDERAELERQYVAVWGKDRAHMLLEYHDRLPLDDPRFGRRT